MEDKTNDERTKASTHTYNGTCYCFARYLVLRYVRKKAQRSMAQHRTVGQGTEPHGTARTLRCAAEL